MTSGDEVEVRIVGYAVSSDCQLFETGGLDVFGCCGIIQDASLGDYVFADNNGNGFQDAGDTPIQGATVNLYDANDLSTPIATTTTDENGFYEFAGLDSNLDYVVEFETPTGYEPTIHTGNASDGIGDDNDAGADGFTNVIDLNPGEHDPTIDAGFLPQVPDELIDLELTKTANVTEAANGDLVTYTISVTNQGPGDATGVSVSDVLPAGVSYSSSSPSKGTFTSGSTSLGSIEVSVGSSTDDAEEKVSSGNVNLTSSDLEMTEESSTQLIGMRFQNLDIPAGAVITNAYIQFTVDEVANIATNLIIQGEDIDDAVTFSTTTNDISSRSTTTANVSWNPAAWNTVGEAGSNQQTPDLSPIVQEIVNRGGWNAGNDMVFIVSGSGKRVAESYNGSTTAAPKLTVEFINGGLWNIGSLANGETATLDIEVVIDDISSPITNFAQVETADQDDVDSTPGNDTNGTPDEDDEDDVTITPQAPLIIDLELTKTADVSTAANGDIVNFTVSVSNLGPDDATGVSVEDVLPAGVSYNSSTPSTGTFNDATGIWTIGDMANGTSESLVINTTVVDISSPITNFAQVETADQDDVDSTPGNDTNGTPDEDDEDDVTITPQAPLVIDLELTKTADVSTAANGDIVNFTLTVTNNGPDDATGVSVEDIIPSGLSYNSASPSKGSYSDANGIWTIGNMANGATETIVINTTVVDISSPITNFAQVETADQDDVDSTPGNDTNGTPNEDDEDDVTITPQAPLVIDLELTKTADVSTAANGDIVNFTVSVSNLGPDDATGVSVEDIIPSGVSYNSSSPSAGSYNDATGIWTIGNMANGASETIVINTTVVDISSPITNFAQVETADQDDIDSTPGNDTNGTPNEDDEDNVTITPEVPLVIDLELTKTADVSTAANGDIVNFTVSVSNLGPDDATGVSVEDILPGGVSYNSSSPSAGSYTMPPESGR